jgi:hypothetical protein
MDFLFIPKIKRLMENLIGRYHGNWEISIDGERQFPTAELDCPHCHQKWTFPLIGDGQIPMARCCPKAEPYPTKFREFWEHLSRKALPVTEAQAIKKEGIQVLHSDEDQWLTVVSIPRR